MSIEAGEVHSSALVAGNTAAPNAAQAQGTANQAVTDAQGINNGKNLTPEGVGEGANQGAKAGPQETSVETSSKENPNENPTDNTPGAEKEAAKELATSTERVVLSEGVTQASEYVNPEGKVTAIRASVQVEVGADGVVTFTDIQMKAFEIVGLSVTSIRPVETGLSIVITDSAPSADTQFYVGELGNGERLPAWIRVERNTGEISLGKAPEGVSEITVRVKAIGSDGKIRMLDIELNLDELLKGKSGDTSVPAETESETEIEIETEAETEAAPESSVESESEVEKPKGFASLATQVASEVSQRDSYGERLMKLLDSV